MTITAVLLPLFVEVALTFALGFWMASLRVRAVRGGEVHPRDIALREPNWPPRRSAPGPLGLAAHPSRRVAARRSSG